MELHDLTLAQAARAIATRALSPAEYAEALIARCEALEPQLHAFITPTFDLARAQARKATEQAARGPLHGIPIGLKDIFDTEGIRTTGHSRSCIDRVPPRDCTAWTKLREAGAVLMGKLATHEFAHGGPSFDLPWPPARNPWNTAHATGGSSSGSGAAVAAGMMPGAMGSDTGGSIRIPAGHCGITGLKPTYGLVSRAGVLPNSWSLDHVGPMARTAEDCALLLQAIAGADPADPTSSRRPVPDFSAGLETGIKGLRIGVLRHIWQEAENPSPDLAPAMDAAIGILRALGAEIEETRIQHPQRYGDVKIVLGESELLSLHLPALRAKLHEFGQDFRAKSLAACLFTAEDHVQASRRRRVMVAEMRETMRRFDLLLAPGMTPPPRLDAGTPMAFWGAGGANVTSVFNVTGQPALALPCGLSRAGLPISLQLAARPFEEALLLRAGVAYERAAGWCRRRPPLVPGAAPAALSPQPWQPDISAVPGPIRDRVITSLRAAGIEAPEPILTEVIAVAPLTLALAARVSRDLPMEAEVASVFDPLG